MELLAKVEPVDGKSEQDLHPGCVKRVLTVRDRLLIFQALNSAVAQGADPKTLARLVTLRETLDQDGVDDYFSAMEKEFAKRFQVWGEAFKAHVTAGAADPGPKPKQTDDELLGHSSTYWLKPKLDSHIQDTIKSAKFDGGNAKHVVSLFQKYGIPIED